MNKTLQWIIGGSIILITVLIIFSMIWPLFVPNTGWAGYGMMGPGMMGGWGFGPFGLIFMWLMPVGFVVLTVLSVVWLVRAVGGGMNPVAPTRTCPSCGRAVQADWKACPHCGVALV